ncbi:MAG: amidohydrolase, partial [Oscillospiraceae bacterium]|nr:amidohydrolase [Oscillospiraceae bacterium]
MNMYQTIIEKAEAATPEMITLRRDFHKYAETGWLEMRTASIIARKLTELGYEVLIGEEVCKREDRMGVPSDEVLKSCYERAIEQGADPEFVKATEGGFTGVIGILRCGEGPTVAMRFDIDALGVNESTDDDHIPAKEGFMSVNAGSMHACGHDGHA